MEGEKRRKGGRRKRIMDREGGEKGKNSNNNKREVRNGRIRNENVESKGYNRKVGERRREKRKYVDGNDE